MATPTIVRVTPSIGLPAGDTLITVEATNLRPPVHPDPGVVDPDDAFDDIPRTAAVFVDGVAASDVRVYSTQLLTFLLPQGNPGDPDALAGGRTVSLTITNLDQATGLPISGESVTAANAFTYIRPAHTAEFESDFTRVQRTLLQMLKKQLLAEVNYAVQTDYDPTTGDEMHVTQFAKLPGIVLVGPDLRENRFYSRNDQSENDQPDGTVSVLDGESPAGYFETRVPYTVDVLWEVIAASNNKVELLNLQANFVMFMHHNKWISILRNPADASKGSIRFELDFQPEGQPQTTTIPNNSNVRSWSAKILIRGFDIEAFSGLKTDGTPDPSNLVPAHAVVDHPRAADTIHVDATKLAK